MRLSNLLLRGVTTTTLFSAEAIDLGSTLPTRDLSACPDTYTAPDGLTFSTQCGKNINCDGSAGCDYLYWFHVSNIQDCMKLCSGAQPLCTGLTYVPASGVCVLKNNVITQSMFESNSSTFSATANTTQITGTASTSCPHQNGTSFTSTSGLQMSMLCGVNFASGGYAFPNIVYGAHADTFDDCVTYCANAHPLCRGVTWNPNMKNGYGNCYLRNDTSGVVYNPSGYTAHSAKIVDADLSINSSIPTSGNYTSGGLTFVIAQDVGRINSTNSSSIHASNIGSCIDACAQSKTTCLGVVLDQTFASGFQNCYLLNSTGVAQQSSKSVYARLANATTSGSDPTATGNSDSGSSSKAWIAAVVICPLAVIAAAVAGFIWYRKRKHRRAEPVETAPIMTTAAPQDEKSFTHYDKPELDSHTYERAELESTTAVDPVMLPTKDNRYELPSQAAPVELPADPKHR